MTAFWMFRMRFPRLQVMDLHRISCGRQLPKARWQGNRWCLGRGGFVNCWKMLELVSILRFVRWKSVILLLTESHLFEFLILSLNDDVLEHSCEEQLALGSDEKHKENLVTSDPEITLHLLQRGIRKLRSSNLLLLRPSAGRTHCLIQELTHPPVPGE